MVKAGTPAGLKSSPRQLAGVGNPAANVLVGAPDEGDYLLGDSIVPQ